MDARPGRIGREQLASHPVEALELEEGHRAHAQMILEALDQAAAAGVHLAAQGIEGDRPLRILRHPPLGEFDDLDPGRRTRQAPLQLGPMDEGLHQQRHQVRLGKSVPACQGEGAGVGLGRGEQAPQGVSQHGEALGIQRHPVGGEAFIGQGRRPEPLRPVREAVPIDQHHRQLAGRSRGEMDLAPAFQPEEAGFRQEMAMGTERRGEARIEAEGHDLPAGEFRPAYVDAHGEAETQELQGCESEKEQIPYLPAPCELEQLDRQTAAPQQGLRLLHAAEAPLTDQGRGIVHFLS